MKPEFDRSTTRSRPVALASAPAPAAPTRPAAARAVDVEHWLEAPAISSPSLAPDGRTVAYVSDASGAPALWTSPLGPAGLSEADARLIDTGPAHVRGVSYAPDGRWIALEVAPGGGEHTQVYLVRPDGSGGRLLAGRPAADDATALGSVTERAAILGRWTGDGALLGLSITRDDGLVEGQLADPDSGRRIHVATGVALQVDDVSRDGRHALIRRGPRGHREVVLIELGSGIERVLTVAGRATGTVGFGRFFVDGHTAYLQSDAGRERVALFAVRLPERGGPRPCGLEDTADPAWADVQVLAERDDADLERFTLVPDGHSVVLAWNVAGRTELELLDLATLRRQALPPLPRAVATSVLVTPDGSRLVLALDGPTVPGQLWTYDVTSGAAGYRCLLAPAPAAGPGWVARALAAVPVERGALDRARPAPALAPEPVRPTLRHLRTHDGLRLSGWLYRPRGAQGAGPAVIHLHGGPEAQERPTYNPLFQALAEAGVTVFAPNVRGSSGYGRSFMERDDLAGRFDGIGDVAACARHLVEAGIADPARVGVMGRSYGGYLTLASLVEFPELFAVGVDICGMADLRTFYERTEPWIAAAAITKYGHPEHDRDLLAALSPIHRFDRLVAPLLVVHGANDTNVPLFEAEQTVAAATAVGVPVRFLLFDDEGHEARGTANRMLFVRTVVAWLLDHLTPVEVRHAV